MNQERQTCDRPKGWRKQTYENEEHQCLCGAWEWCRHTGVGNRHTDKRCGLLELGGPKVSLTLAFKFEREFRGSWSFPSSLDLGLSFFYHKDKFMLLIGLHSRKHNQGAMLLLVPLVVNQCLLTYYSSCWIGISIIIYVLSNTWVWFILCVKCMAFVFPRLGLIFQLCLCYFLSAEMSFI